ncbi:MAG: pirin family protein [Nocardioides sp.]
MSLGETIPAREVPLGGPRAMTVWRTLPARGRTLIGAWCFADHFGAPRFAADRAERGQADGTGRAIAVSQPASSTPMVFAPHPHTGLQTVSWLFSGEVIHRDSAGNHALVRPGELNLMTAGRGISHSEVSVLGSAAPHGVQLWVALPDRARDVAPSFDHFAPEPVAGPGWVARVFLGAFGGARSPVHTHTPLLGAELVVEPGVTMEVPLDPTYEYGVLLDSGRLRVQGRELAAADLRYLPPGPTAARLVTYDVPARLLLLGGPPLGERIVMWWNFIGRSHEEIEEFRRAWHTQIVRSGDLVGDGQQVRPGRFGVVVGESLAPIPAPTLPNTRLLPRG